ncbi:MAG: TlpA family protein disulfide reductase, partial [Planctomycetaceae bacterium]|nr:TlpA family protein disulfide reductase [Planctomycetaceae bacterium]
KNGTWQDVEAIIKKNPGKVVVVDIWSTSCLPCMAEFPNLVKLHNQHAGKVVCVSLNVDYVGIRTKPPESYRARVEGFLTKKKATCTNLLCTQEADALFDSLKLSSIPAVYVYGKDGKLAKRFDASLELPDGAESFSYEEHINPLIESLLK